ncbi:MAG: low molecular weight phosphatase family protein [Alphaproteobacteria bacterium]|nr:low molecular weight phosphatase family protein [Alphaproteobacteria bacterium]
MVGAPRSVLFACTMNVVRSPIAEAIMKHLFGHRIYVDSAGTRRGEPDPFVVAAMEEIGIDLARHRPKTFDDLEDLSYDLVISLAPDAQHRAIELTRHMACDVEYWATLDPSVVEGSRDMRLNAYRQVRDGLWRRIEARFGETPPTT